MEIRALTGFSEQVLRKYGRSYTPINGCSQSGLGELRADPVEVVDTKTTINIPPITLLLLGIGIYAVYKNLK